MAAKRKRGVPKKGKDAKLAEQAESPKGQPAESVVSPEEREKRQTAIQKLKDLRTQAKDAIYNEFERKKKVIDELKERFEVNLRNNYTEEELQMRRGDFIEYYKQKLAGASAQSSDTHKCPAPTEADHAAEPLRDAAKAPTTAAAAPSAATEHPPPAAKPPASKPPAGKPLMPRPPRREAARPRPVAVPVERVEPPRTLRSCTRRGAAANFAARAGPKIAPSPAMAHVRERGIEPGAEFKVTLVTSGGEKTFADHELPPQFTEQLAAHLAAQNV